MKEYLRSTLSKFIASAFILMFTHTSFAQPGAQYTYDLNSTTFPNYPNFNTWVLNGANMYVGGTTNINTGIEYYAGLSKLDTSGNLLWLKGYQNPADIWMFNMFDFKQAGTNLLLTGKTSTSIQAAFLSLVDANTGAVVNSKTYTQVAFGGLEGHVARPLPAGAGGAYALAGRADVINGAAACGGYLYDGVPDGADILLIKTDVNLDTVFCRRYSLNFPFTCGISVDSASTEIVTDFVVSNTAMFFAGWRWEPDGKRTGFILSTDFLGNVLWSKTYYFGAASPYDIIQSIILEGSDIIAVGNSFSLNEQFAMRVNASNGNVSWAKTYSGSILNYNAKVIKDNQDGNFIISGTSPNNNWDMVMYKIDGSNGNIVSSFTKQIGIAGKNEGAAGLGLLAEGATALQAANGTYFLCGMTNVGGVTGGFQMNKLHKTYYSSGCNEATGTITATARTMNTRDPLVRVYSNGLVPAAMTLNVTDYTTGVTATTVCTYSAFSAGASGTNLTCNGGANGTATATATGGSPNYTYSWSNTSNTVTASLTNTITGLAAGTYSVTITSSTGTTSTASVTITQPSVVSASVSSSTNVTCNGANTGSATASGSGGTGAISYTWSNGGGTATINSLTAGTYTVTVRDASLCSAISTVTITQPSAVSATATPSANVLCNGGSTGSAAASGSGGTGSYNYSWSTTASSQTISGLSAGIYTVTVRDGNNCTSVSTVSITQPASSVSASTSNTGNVNCFGGSNGSASAAGAGGAGGFTYSWSNSATGAAVSGLTAATYTVTVTDANSCTSVSTVTITQPSSALSSSAAISANVLCNGGSTGAASASASGGTTNYSYLWSNAVSGATITNVTAGTYVVTVTDNRGCTSTSSVNITQPAAALSSTANTTQNVSCNGGSNGAVSATASGGTTSYNYSWSTTASSQSISGLTAGTYTVTITDANSCTSVSTTVITAPPVLDANVSASAATCGSSNGSAVAVVFGGSPGFTLTWSSGAAGYTATGLASGTYTVTITDNNGCAKTVATVVNNSGAATINSITTTTVSCNGASTGTAIVNASGGTGTLSYSWQPSGGTGLTASNLAAGTYTIVVTDANGCVNSSNTTINQAAALVVSPAAVTATCGNSNGSINSNASGGTGTLTYSWSNSATSANITGLAPATYTVTVTDQNGCTGASTASINNAAGATVASASSNNVTCNGGSDGSAFITTSGGTAPLNYSWSSGSAGLTATNLSANTYTVTVSDANSCIATSVVTITQPPVLDPTMSLITQATCGNSNGSLALNVSGGSPAYNFTWTNGAVTQTISNLAAGGYTVTVTDGNGCSKEVAGAITNQAGAVITAAAPTNVLCNGNNTGSAVITVSGGSAPLNYTWSSGSSGLTESNLSAGSYVVTVSDVNNCTATSVVVITEPSVISGTVTPTAANCGSSNGSAVATVSGGAGGYSLTWSSGAAGNTATGLAAGAYDITVTDANSCQQLLSTIINNNGGATINSVAQTDVLCNGAGTGAASANASGGTGTLTYTWLPSGGNGVTASNLTAGSYTVLVTDANSCLVSSIVTITEPGAVATSSTVSAASCGNTNGSATVNVSGGTPGYNYSWNTGALTATITNLAAGTYSVTVTDANSCTAVQTATINSIGGANISLIDKTNINCFGNNNGTATVFISGGAPSYTYSWSSGVNDVTGGTSSSVNNLTPGTYTVTITDVSGCPAITTVSITEPSAALTALGGSVSFTCGQNNGEAGVAVSGGTVNYNYSWSNGSNAQTITGLGAGTFTVTVTDANGCVSLDTVTVNGASGVVLSVNQTDASCSYSSDGNVFVVPTGTSPFTYTWSTGSSAQTITNVTPGSYNVTVTDAVGCSSSSTVIIGTSGTTPTAGFTYSPVPAYSNNVVSFTDQSSNATSWLWNFGEPVSGTSDTSTLSNPTHTFADTGNFCVMQVAVNGVCVDTAITCIDVAEKCEIPDSIPNVFSPNNDVVNDLFLIKSTGLAELICTVYNRWGMKLYEYNAIRTGWDGRTFTDLVAPAGTYYYILDATCADDGRKLEGHGSVQLVR